MDMKEMSTINKKTSAKYDDYPYLTLHKCLYKIASLSVAEKFRSV